MKEPKPIELDGRTGEGGGQLVRLAVALAAVSTRPIRITHVRGNRQGGRGGGLKAQHVASIAYLAQATDAEVTGLSVGSHTLEFRPRRRPSELVDRRIKIGADVSAASTLLIFQAIFPFLLFAGNEKDEPIEIEISGGTNVSWSLSWEYLDQVLLPTLEDRFGIVVERKLLQRGWSAGAPLGGKVWFRVRPVGIGKTLTFGERVTAGYTEKDFDVRYVDVSILAPLEMHEGVQNAVVKHLEEWLPKAELNFKVLEDTMKDSRVYVLLVARSDTLRWGRDILTSVPKKQKKGQGDFSEYVARKVGNDLYDELEGRGTVDEYLQDQLVVFQALAEGWSSFPRSGERDLEEEMADLPIGDQRLREEKAQEPFGEGSLHTTTARWVTAELLADVAWYDKGRVCRGVGTRMVQPG